MKFLFVGSNICRQLLSDSQLPTTPLLLTNDKYCNSRSGLAPYSIMTMPDTQKEFEKYLSKSCSNAVKYRSADRKAKIIVETEKSGDYILLKVQDNGLGIKEEDIKKVFLMYQRLHDHVDGTGVGMAILKRILDNTAGKIELDSQLGEGSTFKIFLVNS